MVWTSTKILLLVLALAAAMTTSPVGAQRILKAADVVVSERALQSEEAQPMQEKNVLRALLETNASSSNASAESSPVSLSKGESATASTTTEESSGSTKTEKHAEGPTLSSFTGPMLAGAVAILLIGFVIAFKNRKSSN